MVDENKVRESFFKIREDILYLQQEITILRQEIEEIRQSIARFLICRAYPHMPSTHSTKPQDTTHIPTHNLSIYSPIQPNFHSSIGNEGVPTDTQHINNRQISTLKRTSEGPKGTFPEGQEEQEEQEKKQEDARIFSVSRLMDNLKRDLGEKFKRLTKQEFLIFSVIYTLDEELGRTTYNDIARRTGLTESSVRDYVRRLITKGIPIAKEKLNNKTIILKIPRELKDLATLDKLSKLSDYDR
ncbi:MAG: winged helix-turn-helix domain-containing protein [Candidatus Pacearchaeota archaeon]|nr:winged helix-turn-helix domain-containing protein [Candidatus Pacearchaeota archaeon]